MPASSLLPPKPLVVSSAGAGEAADADDGTRRSPSTWQVSSSRGPVVTVNASGTVVNVVVGRAAARTGAAAAGVDRPAASGAATRAATAAQRKDVIPAVCGP